MFLRKFFAAPEFEATISRRLNPGKSGYLGSVRYAEMATLLLTFIPSVSNKRYYIIIKVLPEYVFGNPQHDFLRFILYIEDERRSDPDPFCASKWLELGGEGSSMDCRC